MLLWAAERLRVGMPACPKWFAAARRRALVSLAGRFRAAILRYPAEMQTKRVLLQGKSPVNTPTLPNYTPSRAVGTIYQLMHADRASRFDAPPPPSALLRQAMQEGLVPLTADAATKSRRELFVGNTPANTTERGLADHLNAALRAAGFCTAPGAPVISCRVSAAYAFVELRSVQETDNCLSLTGLPFLGGALKIGRPTKYDGPRTVASSWARVAQTIDAASLAERKSNFAVRRPRLHHDPPAIDATSARRRAGAGLAPLDSASTPCAVAEK